MLGVCTCTHYCRGTVPHGESTGRWSIARKHLRLWSRDFGDVFTARPETLPPGCIFDIYMYIYISVTKGFWPSRDHVTEIPGEARFLSLVCSEGTCNIGFVV